MSRPDDRVETVAQAISDADHAPGVGFAPPWNELWPEIQDHFRRLAAAAIAADPSPACTAEHCDRACEDVIAERDRVEDLADQLAYAVAPAEVIGEHSSANSPWQNALDILRERPAPSPAEEAVKRVEAVIEFVDACAVGISRLNAAAYTDIAARLTAALASPAPAPQDGER